jgi:hypothetical protein
MARDHWETCIAHFDQKVQTFADEYFGASERRCLVVAAAGFDPRSRRITEILASALGDRLEALFVREERGKPDASLLAAAEENQVKLERLVKHCKVVTIDVFGDDDAPVGGARIAKVLAGLEISADITDVVLDMSAMSVGIGFPAARLLLEGCEAHGGRAFHVMIASNPELDDKIASEPGGRAMAIRGFPGEDNSSSSLRVARLWIPQLARGRAAALNSIGRSLGECYKICPILPFPAGDPRRADALIGDYHDALIDEWQVDPRDIVYASERNPLDGYRTLSTLAGRFRQAVSGVFAPSIVVSPIGSKVMAAGALMAALEHDLTVQYIETVRYDFDPATPPSSAGPEQLVHLLLSGPAYGDYGKALEGSR